MLRLGLPTLSGALWNPGARWRLRLRGDLARQAALVRHTRLLCHGAQALRRQLPGQGAGQARRQQARGASLGRGC